jgi:hypothetical protein
MPLAIEQVMICHDEIGSEVSERLVCRRGIATLEFRFSRLGFPSASKVPCQYLTFDRHEAIYLALCQARRRHVIRGAGKRDFSTATAQGRGQGKAAPYMSGAD